MPKRHPSKISIGDLRIGDRFRVKTKAEQNSHYEVTGFWTGGKFNFVSVRDLNNQPLACPNFCEVNIDWWSERGEIILGRDVIRKIKRAEESMKFLEGPVSIEELVEGVVLA
jgi:hypothetical protein